MGGYNVLIPLFAPVIYHVIHGGGYQSGNILGATLLSIPAALFHIRISWPIELGLFVLALRTVICTGLLWFDNLLYPLDGLTNNLTCLVLMSFHNLLIPLGFAFSLWKVMKRSTELLGNMHRIVYARECAREVNDMLINSLCPPQKAHLIAQNFISSVAISCEPEVYEDCTLLQMDIKGFTALSSRISATELVDLINAIFTSIDEAAEIIGCVWKV